MKNNTVPVRASLDDRLAEAEARVATAREAHYLAKQGPQPLRALISQSKTLAAHERAMRLLRVATMVPVEMAIHALGEAEAELDRVKALYRSVRANG